MSGPLQGLKIFDMTHAALGPWGIMLLAAMGANVIKVEIPQGDGIRRMKPRYRDLAAVYMHCNLGKKGIYLDLKSKEGKKAARELLKDADVFAENLKFGAVDRLEFGYRDAIKLNPNLVYGNFPGWGSSGPLSHRGSTDPMAQAFSGAVSITGERGGRGEFNRWYGLHDFSASSFVAVSILLGLLYRERVGCGVRVENAQMASSVAIQTTRIAEFLATGKNVPCMGSATTTTVPHRAFQCLDKRWLAVGVISDRQWKSLCKAIVSRQLQSDMRFATNYGRVKHRDELENRLQEVFAAKPARWWVIQLRKFKVPVSLFYDYEAVPELEQVKANRYIVKLKYPKVGTLPFGNIPFQYSKTPVALKPGPWPGQDTERVLKDGWGHGPTLSKGYFGPSGSTEKGVLNGITVVDMTQGLTGPYSSLLLADAGAKVIKIEPPDGDYGRHFGPPFVGEVSAVFFHLNRNKKGVRLDTRKEADRQYMLKILKDTDVFIEDEGQSRMKRLGLSYKDIEKINPGLIYCSISPYGTKGPLRNDPASELTVQAMSDFLGHLGVAGEEPIRLGPDMASLGTSLYAIIGILGGLYHKWRTGEGQQITVSLLATMIHQRGINWASIIDPDEWAGFYCEGYTKPQSYGYKTADQPVSIASMHDLGEFHEFMKALNMEHLVNKPIFQCNPNDLLGWMGAGDTHIQLQSVFEEGFQKWSSSELLDILDKFGGFGAPVNTYQELFRHPQMGALDMVREINGRSLGKVKCVVAPWNIGEIPKPKPLRYISPF
jgi:crotonobetainyl-CoA:carnitine CoA-transferase CaiB-like acyl-CoA transferase